VKFVVLLAEPDHYARWTAMSDDEQQAVFDTFHAFDRAIGDRGGSLLGGEGLAGPRSARTLRPGPGRLVTDGPYAEAAEQLGGFFIVEALSIESVLEAARVLPDTLSIEVRPVEGSVEGSVEHSVGAAAGAEGSRS
jgi:hypothetical protein